MSKKLFTLIIIILSIFIILFFLIISKNKTISIKLNHFYPKLMRNINVKSVSILITGDIMLGRSTMTKSLNSGDAAYPFRKVADKLRQVDIVFSNLEGPIVSNCPKIDEGYKFCADPKMIEGLVFSGMDIVNLANNHILNYGKTGLEETKKVLNDNQIKWVGDGNLEIIEKNGTKFGFLGFDFVTKTPNEKDFQLVKDSNQKVDLLIVGVHWGNEYSNRVTVLQEQIARKMIENGADMIAGHHPHWAQSVEYINGKPVCYSLGNFVFDQAWSEETKKALVVELVYQGDKLKKIEKMPIYMKNFAQPEWINK